MKIPENGFYYHYKHDPKGPFNNYCYKVIGTARNTEDESFSVLYVPLYENDWFKPANYQSRPLDMFNENVTIEGKTIPRFQRITDPNLIAQLDAIKEKMYRGDLHN